jgi:hypothetical protein
MWHLQTVPKGYFLTPGIFYKVEISAQENKRHLDLKMKTQYKNALGAANTCLKHEPKPFLILKIVPKSCH